MAMTTITHEVNVELCFTNKHIVIDLSMKYVTQSQMKRHWDTGAVFSTKNNPAIKRIDPIELIIILKSDPGCYNTSFGTAFRRDTVPASFIFCIVVYK